MGNKAAFVIARKGVDRDARVRVAGSQYGRFVDEQLVGLEQRAFDIATAIVKARSQCFPTATNHSLESEGGIDDDGAFGQVIEQRGRFFKEKRQIKLDASRRHAIRYAAIDGAAGRITLEAGTVATPESAYRIAIKRDFASGQQTHRGE